MRNILGGDTDLSDAGREYGKYFSELLNEKLKVSSSSNGSSSNNNKTTAATTTTMVYIGSLKRYTTMANLLVNNTNTNNT